MFRLSLLCREGICFCVVIAGVLSVQGESLPEADEALRECSHGVAEEPHLSLPREEELKGLELLQLEVRLQSDLVHQAAPASPGLPLRAGHVTPAETTVEREGITSLPVRASRSEHLIPLHSVKPARSDRSDKSAKKKLFNATRPFAKLDDVAFRSPLSTLSLIQERADTSPVRHVSGQHLFTTKILMGLRKFTVSHRSQSFAMTIICVLLAIALGLLCITCMWTPVHGKSEQGHEVLLQKQTRSRSNPDMDKPFGQIGGGNAQGMPRPEAGSASVIPGSRSPFGARSRSGAAPEPETTEIPPLCPSLILPHTEARFVIPIENLMRPLASGELDIRGTSGKKLLHGNVKDTGGRKSISLASCGFHDEPRVTVCSPAQSDTEGSSPTGSSKGAFEIFGKDNMLYGELEPAERGGFLLQVNGQAVMSLEVGSGDLKMTASSMDGRLLASAGKNVQVTNKRMDSHDTWKLQVKPGCDAVLIAACMLGVLIFSQ